MKYAAIFFMILLIITDIFSKNNFEVDTIKTAKGKLLITFIGHGTLMFQINDEIIHVDPVSQYADYSSMPKADIILITHHHGDHLDPAAVDLIKTSDTKIICTESCLEKLGAASVLNNGQSVTVDDIKIEAVPAYNLIHKRDFGEPFHPKGTCNGYVLTIGGKKIYIAGDTENVPEMKNLKNIDIAFLPMNLPYTMTPEMVADAVNLFHPKILYPYHFGETDVNILLNLLKGDKTTQVKVRKMK